MKGGSGGRDTLLLAHSGDMHDILLDAIMRFDIIVLDGSDGPFTLSSRLPLTGLRHKTIEGRNGAVLQTQFRLDGKIHSMLDSARVKTYSSMASGDVTYSLSNGRKVREECEYRVRQLMIDYLKDRDENYRMAGIMSVNGCEDIILRGLVMQGPGAVDVSGKDVLTIGEGSVHIWVDHCDLRDGMDGNFDITTRADFISVTNCTFSYTERSYMHRNSNLIGSSDNAALNGEDCLNVTFADCLWGRGCDQRMPMVRFGRIHLLRCIFDCPGCHLAVNARKGSEVLMEQCVWKAGVKRVFAARDAKAYEFRDCIFEEGYVPENLNSVTMPY